MTDTETVRKVARTARLNLTDSEAEKMSKDLLEILNYFRSLSKAKTAGVRPSFQPIEIKNATRKDQVKPSLPRNKALANTKNKKDSYFVGPRSL